jgi:hypothetical protein
VASISFLRGCEERGLLVPAMSSPRGSRHRPVRGKGSLVRRGRRYTTKVTRWATAALQFADGVLDAVQRTTAGVVASVVVLHLFAFQGTDFQPGLLVDGWKGMAAFVGDAFPPDLDWGQTVKPGLEATLVTLWIGLLGATL